MGEMKDGGAIDLNHVEEEALIDGGERAVGAEAGVVDEDIDVETTVSREGEDSFRRVGLGEIGGEDFGADFVGGGESLRERLQAIGAAGRQDEVCAAGSEFCGER